MRKQRIVTHNGGFHPDELFAAAIIILVLEKEKIKYEIVRTRDETEIAKGDFVIDVGRVYEPDKNRFDHHQIGGAGKRPNGIPYATFGLVWQKFGPKLCSHTEVAERLDQKVAQTIDAQDNGVAISQPTISGVKPYELESAISSFVPTWNESDENIDNAFLKTLGLVKEVLIREIKRAEDFFLGKQRVLSAYQNAEDKRIIVLDNEYSFNDVLIDFPEPLYVISPRKVENRWGVVGVRKDPYGFEIRKDLPEEWAGKSGEELAKVSGVPDAYFCHTKRFLAVADSKEGALAMARIAADS